MPLRSFVAAGAGLVLLTQTALAFSPPARPAAEGGRRWLLLAQAQPDPVGAHGAIDWTRERLSEIDATIATLEENARTLSNDARLRAEATLEKLRATRDAYRAEVERALADSQTRTQAQIAESQAALQGRWDAFEQDVEAYFTTVNSEVAVRKAVFEARLQAQLRHWQQAIDDLKASAATVAAEQRAALDARIAELQAQVDAAKARLAEVRQAGDAVWSDLRNSLADARRLFDRTYESVKATIDRARR